MEIIRDIYAMEKAAAPTYIAIGSFDGIHPGHRKLIGETIRKAREAKGKSVVFTFSNHPLEIVKSDFKPQFITTLEEKTEILQQTGIDILVLQPFTKEFAALEPGEFLQLLRDKLNAKELFVGFNFTFGNKGKGTAETLTAMAPEFQMDVTVLPPVQIRKKTLSSTLIRDCIREGNMEEAARYLGYPFFVEGSVVHGEKIARNLGFPTANLTFDGKIIPRAGVYGGLAVTETGGAKRPCLINIGDNPAPREGERVLEAHIFNFGGDLYGKVIRVELLHYLREQKKFDSVELLKEAIRQDAENWKREYLKNFTGRPGDPPVDMEQIVLKLDNFEGPLDLLLTLIHKKKLKIAEIRMSQLIDDYLEVVNQAGGENLEVRVEFSRVATELLVLKAKALIDRNNIIPEEKEWINRLEEYAIFREASEKLKQLESGYNVSYSREGGKKIMPKPMKEYTIGEMQPLDLFRSYAAHLKEQKEDYLEIILDNSYSEEEVALALYEALQMEQRTYDWIFDRAQDKMHLVYLFLSVLKLYKDGYISLTEGGVVSTGKIWTNLTPEAEQEAQHV